MVEKKSPYLIIKKGKTEGKKDFEDFFIALKIACKKSYEKMGFLIPAGIEDTIIVLLPAVDQNERKKIATNIAEFASGVGIKVDFEKEKKEEKWIPIHEILTELIKKDPKVHFETVIIAYAKKAKIPKKGILKLLRAFVRAIKHVPAEFYSRAAIEKAIKNLKEQQQKEEKEKE